MPKSYGRLAAAFGVHPPRGSQSGQVEEWNSLATICALLTGVAAAGMFIAGEFVGKFREFKVSEVSRDNTTVTTTGAELRSCLLS